MDTPPVSPSPAVAPTISGAVKTAGFFTGKVIAAIVGIAVIGGGIVVGYVFFPEPFYNIVGKYIGLSAPEVVETRATAEEPVEEIPEIPIAEVGTLSEKKTFDELETPVQPSMEKTEEDTLEELKKEDIPGAPIGKEAVLEGKVRRKK